MQNESLAMNFPPEVAQFIREMPENSVSYLPQLTPDGDVIIAFVGKASEEEVPPAGDVKVYSDLFQHRSESNGLYYELVIAMAADEASEPFVSLQVPFFYNDPHSLECLRHLVNQDQWLFFFFDNPGRRLLRVKEMKNGLMLMDRQRIAPELAALSRQAQQEWEARNPALH